MGHGPESLYVPIVWHVYWERLLAKTQHLTAAEFGGYVRLLLHQLQKGHVPIANSGRAGRIMGCSTGTSKQILREVGAFFSEDDDGLWRNRRLEEGRDQQAAAAAKYRDRGVKGSTGRWGPSDGKTRAERLAEAREKGTHTRLEWELMLDAYEYRCVRCGSEVNGRPCKDHIVPIHRGGDDSIRNLQPLCRECNTSKGRDIADHRVGHPKTRPEWLPSTAQAGIQARNNQASDTSKRLLNACPPISDLRSPDQEVPDPTTSTPSEGPRRSSSPLLMSPARYAKLQQTHAFVGSRLHVPHVLHDELRRKLGGLDPDGRLRAWYGALNDEAEQQQAPIPDVFQWLRPKFVEWAREQSAAADLERFRPKVMP